MLSDPAKAFVLFLKKAERNAKEEVKRQEQINRYAKMHRGFIKIVGGKDFKE